MNSPASYKKLTGSKFDLDCPNPSCNGWLNFFAKDDGGSSTSPAYVNCVFKNSKSDSEKDSCGIKIILSKFTSNCRSCKKEIGKGSLIVSEDGRLWMHASCYANGHKPEEEAVSCFRWFTRDVVEKGSWNFWMQNLRRDCIIVLCITVLCYVGVLL